MADILLTVGVDASLSYSEFQSGITNLVSRVNSNPPKIKVAFDIDQNSTKQLQQQITSLRSSMNDIGVNVNTSSAASAMKETANAAKQAQQAMSAAATATKQSANADKEKAAAAKAAAQSQKQAESAIKAYNNAVVQGENALRNWTAAEHSRNQSSREAYTTLQGSVTAMKSAKTAYDQGTGSLKTLQNATAQFRTTLKETESVLKSNGDATKTLSERMGGLATKFASWLTVSQVIMYAVRSIRQLISVSIELDDAMTQMQIVTKASTDEMNEFADSAAAAAQRVASSVSDFVDSATTYARLGYDMDSSSQLAEYTAMLQNVGDIDVSDAQDAITSIVKAFDIDSSEIESVMDKLVTTGNNFPISVSQIAEGMTNASSALSAAGNSFEQSVALLTAANTTIQDASKSSTGLRTIAARIRNTSTELDELGETMTEADYEGLVSALTDAKVAITDNGEFRSTYDILSDIADVWDELSSMEQASITEALAGTRQQAVFYSLIEQFQEASGAMDEMSESAGALNDAYSVYMESTSAHINEFKAAFQGLGSDFFNASFLNGFIDAGTKAISVLDKIVDTLGTIPTIATAATAALSFKNIGILGINTEATALSQTLTVFGKSIKSISQDVKSGQGLFTALFNNDSMITQNDVNCIKEFIKQTKSGISTEQAWANTMTTTSVAGKKMAESVKAGETELESLTASTTAATVATKALNVALNVGLVVAISLITKAVTNAIQKQQELRDSAMDTADAAATESDNIRELYSAYAGANAAYASNTGSKENLESATDSLLEALGLEQSEIQTLAAEYGSLDEAINQVTIDTLKSNLIDLSNGLKAQEEELYSAAKKNAFSTVRDNQNEFSTALSFETDDDNTQKLLDVLRQYADISDKLNFDADLYGITTKQFGTLDLEGDMSSAEGVIETYQDLIYWEELCKQAYADGLLSDEQVVDSSFYQAIEEEKSKIEEEYDGITEYIESINETAAQIQLSEMLSDEGMPETQEEFEAFIQKMKDAAVASDDFKGSQEDIENAIVNTMSEFSDFDAFFEEYNNSLQDTVTEIQSAQDIADSLDIDLNNLISDNPLDYSNIEVPDEVIATWGALQNAIDAYDDGTKNVFDNSAFGSYINDYIDDVNELTSAFTDYSNGDFSNKEVEKLLKKFPQLSNYTGDLDDQIIALLGDMQTDAVGVFAKQFDEVDSEEAREQLQEFEDAVLELGSVVGSTAFEIDIDAETESMEALYAAINESNSATGLTSDSVETLTSRYQNLKDFDAAELFELTANGIHLNRTELQKLETEYKNSTVDDAKNRLEALKNTYDYLTEEIQNCSDTQTRSELYAQRDSILDEIQDVATLATQYEGLTSKYNAYIQAMSTTNERDMYETIIDGYETIQDTIEHGWVDDDVKTYIDLFTFDDMSTASMNDYISAWETLGNTIQGTTYSKLDFFTYDEDGNSTSTGVANFYNAIKQVQDLYEETWAWTDENGTMHLDLGVGGDDELAEALGISEEMVQSLLRALSECSDFEVNLDNEYSEFMNLKDSVEECNDALNEATGTDYTFNVNTDDLESIETQISDLSNIIGDNFIVDGEFDMSIDGAQEAYDIMLALYEKKEEISGEVIMSVNTDGMEGEVYDAVDLLQNTLTEYANYQLNLDLGVDTTESEQTLRSYVDEIAALPANILAALNLDDASVQAAISSVQSCFDENGDLKAGVEVDPEDITTITTAIQGIGAEDLIKAGVDKTLVDEFIDGDYTTDGTVSWKNNTTLIDSYISTTKYASGVVNWSNNTSNVKTSFTSFGSIVGADGTLHAHATGTDVSIKHNEEAVVNELGEEGLIRDGVLMRIPGGMQKMQLKPGDILLNHKQMMQLDDNGYVTANGGRGKLIGGSYANGTMNAYSNANGTTLLSVSGSVKSSSLGSNSSNKSSSSPSNSSSSDATEEAEEFYEILDWIETKIDRIERAISSLDLTASSVYQSWSTRMSALSSEITSVTDEINLQQAAYNRYIQEANSVGLSDYYKNLVQNGAINIETIEDEDLADLIEQYQEWYEKALDCKDAMEELKETQSELYEAAFDAVATQYEAIIQVIEHNKSMLDEAISQAEESGYIVSTKYYEALIAQEQKNIAQLEKEKADLTSSLADAVNSGAITKGSEEWYEMCQSIDDVTLAIEEANTALIEYSNNIRDIEWEIFDLIEERISSITTEADFLIDLLDSADLYDDRGQFTDEGWATAALHGQNYNVYLAQAEQYADEIAELDKEIAADPYDQDLIDRRQELLELQQEMILAAEDEKDAIVSMVEEGIELELDALQNLIDTYTDALDAQKDLYDYQNKVAEQTAEIASIQKQLSAYAGDTSEETKAKVQELRVSLEEAQSDLEETEYEQYIADTKQLLDELYEEYETILNMRLDDIDALLIDIFSTINENSTSVNDTLTTTAESVGYTLSAEMESIWGAGGTVLTTMSANIVNGISSASTTINSTLGTINTNISKMIEQLDTLAKTKTSAATTSSSTASTSTSVATTSTASTSTSTSNTSSSSSSASSWGSWFISKTDSYPKSKLNTETSIVDRLKYHNYDSSFSARSGYYSAMGGSGTYTGSSSQNVWMISQMKSHGFQSGGTIGELIQKSGEDGFILARTGEEVLSLEKIKAMGEAFAKLNPVIDTLDDIVPNVNNVTPISNATTSANIDSINLDITLPGITNYEEFRSGLISDKTFCQAMQAITIDRMFGGSALKKNKYR